jgi:hypothetical protein
MASIVTQFLNIVTGAKPTLAAATVSDDYDCGPGCFAVIAVGATSTTITVVDPRTNESGLAMPDTTFAGLTSVEKWIPLPSFLANANGKATVTCSQVTGVTAAGVSTR